MRMAGRCPERWSNVRRTLTVAALVAGLLASHAGPVDGQTDLPTRPANPQSESPASLTASVTLAGVSLSWTAPTLETETIGGYRVERRRVLDFETRWLALVDHTGDTTTSHVDASASVNGAEYEYRVSAVRGEGSDQALSAASNVATVTIPSPPRPIDLTASSVDDGIELSWSAGHLSWQSDWLRLTGYEILRIETAHSGNRNPEWEVLVNSTNSTDTSFLDASGLATIQYSYAIRAVHGYLRGHWEGIAGPVSGRLTPDK